MDFIYYAQVVNANGLDEEMQQLFRERVLANRRASAQLAAANQCLPSWYSNYLIKVKKWVPEDAARNLIGFSNTTERDAAAKIQAHIRQCLGLPPEG